MAGTKATSQTCECLRTERDVIAYLAEAFEVGRASVAVGAFRTIAEANGISPALKRMGMTRDEFRAQVMPRGRPKFDIAMKLVRALGLRFTVSRS